MVVRKANLIDTLHVATQMREWDKMEIFACRWNESVDALAIDVVLSPYCFTIGSTEPIAVMWAIQTLPNVWSIGMFATEKITDISHGITKFAKKHFIRGLVENGATRATAVSMDGHTDAQEWILRLGATHEATHQCYGKNGETFHTFRWAKTDPKYPFWR